MSMIICLLRPLNHDVMAGLAATALLMIHLVPLPFAPLLRRESRAHGGWFSTAAGGCCHG